MHFYPLVATEFWAGLVTFIFFMALFTLWAFVLADIFVRKGLSGWGKAAWIFAIIFFPFIGCFAYLVTQRPTQEEVAFGQRAVGQQATFIESAAEDLDRLSKLRDGGEISDRSTRPCETALSQVGTEGVKASRAVARNASVNSGLPIPQLQWGGFRVSSHVGSISDRRVMCGRR
jgi:energy-coupling factor transporter transmembrane protein EcfT